MTRKLTAEEAVALLERVIERRGAQTKYRNPSGFGVYRYRHGNEPGCVVGWALYLGGWTLADLAAIEETTPVTVDHPGNTLDERTARMWTDRVEPAARRVLMAAQGGQDDARSWGECVELARLRLAYEVAEAVA